MTRDFNRGYYKATDDLMHWLNALDTEGMSVKDLRKEINLWSVTVIAND